MIDILVWIFFFFCKSSSLFFDLLHGAFIPLGFVKFYIINGFGEFLDKIINILPSSSEPLYPWLRGNDDNRGNRPWITFCLLFAVKVIQYLFYMLIAYALLNYGSDYFSNWIESFNLDDNFFYKKFKIKDKLRLLFYLLMLRVLILIINIIVIVIDFLTKFFS